MYTPRYWLGFIVPEDVAVALIGIETKTGLVVEVTELIEVTEVIEGDLFMEDERKYDFFHDFVN